MTPPPPAGPGVGDAGQESRDASQALTHAVSSLGGVTREGQERMVSLICEAIEAPEHVLIQAGTGTGKSLGYLIPALTHAVRRNERVVVSTATLALQRQVVLKDAPIAVNAVEKVTGRRADVALLKGWHNYLCLHRLQGGYADDDAPALFDLGSPDSVAADSARPAAASSRSRRGRGAGTGKGARGRGRAAVGSSQEESLGDQILRLRDWAQSTRTGDRDDLVPGVSDQAWAQVSVAKNQCIGSSCPLRNECFPQAARDEAARADVVITNHAMLGVVAAGNSGALPPHEVLVVDEAHELLDRVRSQGTTWLSAAVVTRVAAAARSKGRAVSVDLEQAARLLGDALDDMPEGRLGEDFSHDLSAALERVEDELREVNRQLQHTVRDLRAAGGADGAEVAAITLVRGDIADLVETIERLTSGSVAARRDVAWIERPRMGQDPPRLIIAPIDVAGSVADTLLEEKVAVFTSATLALGGRFEGMAHHLGLHLCDTPWSGHDVGTPFDYARQGIIYTPTDLPQPGTGISDEALEEIVDLAVSSRGGMLGLFSSRRAAEEAAQALRDRTDLTVFAQGEDQLPSLVSAFTEHGNACLVGTLSLWQGVDVPGSACRLVVIDRIPFPRPNDPVAQARSEAVEAAGGNGFMSVFATHAALLLAQGAGRLIRRAQDRGVVAVLDSRLTTKRYGRFLMASMPPLWPTRDRSVVMGALHRLSSEAAQEPRAHAG